ncbi:MAG: hypothetical protein NTX27_20745 [Verrucomicrobia bacterium]|nr:hypothetical protein [Verrucomicrobiota bacterium]
MIIIVVSVLIVACCILAALMRIESALRDVAWQMKASTEFLQEISFLIEKNDQRATREDEKVDPK